MKIYIGIQKVFNSPLALTSTIIIADAINWGNIERTFFIMAKVRLIELEPQVSRSTGRQADLKIRTYANLGSSRRTVKY